MFDNLDNEGLLATYLLIQKDINDCINNEIIDDLFTEMLDKSKELKDEILRRMKHGRKK